MSAFAFLWKRTIINSIKELKKSPGKLVLIIFLFAMFLFALFASFMQRADFNAPLEQYRIHLFFAVGVFMFYFGYVSGLKKASNFFNMPDVNFLFTSPLKPQAILLYGIVNQAGTILLASIFLFFQSSSLKTSFGIEGLGFFGVISGWILGLLLCNSLSALVYSISSKSPVARIILKIILGIFIAIPVLTYLLSYFNSNDAFEALLYTPASPAVRYFTPFGFLVNFMDAFSQNDVLAGIIWLLVTVWFILLSFYFVIKITPDFYEDVLDAAKNKYEMKANLKEKGNNLDYYRKYKKVKVKSTGIKSGKKESVYFFKQITETRKPFLSLFFSLPTVLFALIGIFYVYVVGSAEYVSALMGVFLYILFFFVMLGNLAGELTKHFVFLTPGSNFKKLFYITVFPIVKMFISFLPMTVILLIGGCINPVSAVFFPIAMTGYYTAFFSGAILARLILGPNNMKGLSAFLTFMIELAVLIPSGIAFGIGIFFDVLIIQIVPLVSLITLSVFSFGTYFLVLLIAKALIKNSEL